MDLQALPPQWRPHRGGDDHNRYLYIGRLAACPAKAAEPPCPILAPFSWRKGGTPRTSAGRANGVRPPRRWSHTCIAWYISTFRASPCNAVVLALGSGISSLVPFLKMPDEA